MLLQWDSKWQQPKIQTAPRHKHQDAPFSEALRRLRRCVRQFKSLWRL